MFIHPAWQQSPEYEPGNRMIYNRFMLPSPNKGGTDCLDGRALRMRKVMPTAGLVLYEC